MTDQNSDRSTRVNAFSQAVENYVIYKADSEEPKNKSEFVFLKRRLIWVSVFCNGYKVQFSSLLFCRWSLNTETKKGILPIVKKKKKPKIGQGVTSAYSDQDLLS